VLAHVNDRGTTRNEGTALRGRTERRDFTRICAMATRAEIETKHKQAVGLHAAGVSKRAIGIRLGVSSRTVRKWLPPTHPRTEDKVIKVEVEALRRLHVSNIEIARRTGVSRQRVAQILGPTSKPTREMKRVLVRIPDVEAARAVAQSLGYRIRNGPNSGHGNISAMLAAIADGEVRIIRVDPLDGDSEGEISEERREGDEVDK
jgi:transcriptional regulator with XRE-family HTH domain